MDHYSTATKVCTKCGQAFPHTHEFFARASRGLNGLNSRCKTCMNAMNKANRHKPRFPAESSPALAEIACLRCRTLKPATTEHFSVDRTVRRGFQSWCKSCHAEYSRNSYASAERKAAEGGKKLCTKCQQLKSLTSFSPRKDGDGYKSWCKACVVTSNLRWQKKNREKVCAGASRRRARIRNAPGQHHTAADITKQLLEQGGQCRWCGAKLHLHGAKKFHVDHVIPLARGGSNGAENIVCACPSCNQSKGARLPDEWINRNAQDNC